jgi:SAM-dependent methyltransferase
MNLKNMPKKHSPNPKAYDFKKTNYINGIPFPRLPEDLPEALVPLKEEYLMRSMDYLDTPEAAPIFEKQADIIMERGYKGLIDVGCRHGPVNDILHYRGYTDYQYFGFDTSPQPIAYANETWQEFKNIEYKVASWEDELPVNFDVDCIIWSGVLLYEPKRHFMIFNDIQKYYDCRGAIIQEPMLIQRDECWREGLTLNTIEDQLHMYDCFKVEHYFIDVPVFSGKRVILDVRL